MIKNTVVEKTTSPFNARSSPQQIALNLLAGARQTDSTTTTTQNSRIDRSPNKSKRLVETPTKDDHRGNHPHADPLDDVDEPRILVRHRNTPKLLGLHARRFVQPVRERQIIELDEEENGHRVEANRQRARAAL